jgi:hypothetical protein
MKTFTHKTGRVEQEYNIIRIFKRTGKHSDKLIIENKFRNPTEAIQYFNYLIKLNTNTQTSSSASKEKLE